MTVNERADKILTIVRAYESTHRTYKGLWPLIASELSLVYEEGRKAGARQGLEDAARIAEAHEHNKFHDDTCCLCGFKIRDAIRARAAEVKSSSLDKSSGVLPKDSECLCDAYGGHPDCKVHFRK